MGRGTAFLLANKGRRGYLERMQSNLTTSPVLPAPSSTPRVSFAKRFFLLFIACLYLGACLALPADAAKHRRHAATKTKTSKPAPDRFAEIVMDAQTGFVLSEKNADKRLYPASTTKLMTLYLVFEAIQNGTLSKSQRLAVSSNAQYKEPSKLGLVAGYTIRTEDAILGVVTRSANDAATVLGEAVGGSETRFARLMTFKAQALGMRNTHFANASGLMDTDNYSTARDMAILGQALMRDFPREYHYFSTPSFTYAGLVSFNHNKLMKTYPGMDGLKTGYVNASGYNLVASAVHDGKRLIGVVFGGKSPNGRNKTMADLLDAGFDQLKDPRVASLIQQRAQLARDGMPKRRPGVAAAAPAPAPAAPAFRPAIPSQADVEEGDTSAGMDNVPPAPAPTRAPTPVPAANALTVKTLAMAPAGGMAASSAIKAPTAPVAPAVTAPSGANPGAIAAPAQPLASTVKPLVAPASAKAAPAIVSPSSTAAKAPSTNLAATPPRSVAGTWAVQVGAYASHDAGMTALKHAVARLPKKTAAQSQYVIAPLMTNRGMIYRARLGGFDQKQAAGACKLLRGSCLVLALQ